jgi:hypothetical protein
VPQPGMQLLATVVQLAQHSVHAALESAHTCSASKITEASDGSACSTTQESAADGSVASTLQQAFNTQVAWLTNTGLHGCTHVCNELIRQQSVRHMSCRACRVRMLSGQHTHLSSAAGRWSQASSGTHG